MKTRYLYKTISLLLTLIMAVYALPPIPTAQAAGPDAPGGYNPAVISYLEEMYGDDAPMVYDLMTGLGLMDSSGAEILYDIDFGGETYTAETIRPLLSDPETDLSAAAYVDGAPISLGDLKKMLEIEEELARLYNEYVEPDVKLTPEHLQSFNSLMNQLEGEGLYFPQNAASAQAISLNAAPPSWAEGRDFDDEVYITAKGRGLGGTYVTFTLNKVQSVDVSFTVETMKAAAQADVDYHCDKQVITIPAGSTEIRYISPLSASWESKKDNKLPSDYSSLEEVRENLWCRGGRSYYLHFYDFKNFDYMNVINDNTYDTETFTHSYAGGAYMAFDVTCSVVTSQQIFAQLEDDMAAIGTTQSTTQSIIDASTPVSNITLATGQVLPIVVTYERLIPSTRPFGIRDHYLSVEDGTGVKQLSRNYSHNEITLSHKIDYSYIVNKDADIRNLKLISSDYTINVYAYAYGIWPAGSLYFDPMIWNAPLNNIDGVSFTNNRADAFAGISLDKDSYKVGDTATVTVTLDMEKGRSNWLIENISENLKADGKLKAAIGKRQTHLVDMYFDESGSTFTGTFIITADMMEDPESTGYCRARIYYNRLSYDDADADFGMMKDMFAYFTIEPVVYATADDFEITYPDPWPSGVENRVYMLAQTSTQLGYKINNSNITYKTDDQFVWSSSDETVAKLSADGKIQPVNGGTVKFTLTAQNNGAQGKAAELTTPDIFIDPNGEPNIIIPDDINIVWVRKGNDARIIWSTNLMAKAKEANPLGPEKTNFTVQLLVGNYDKERIEEHIDESSPITVAKEWAAPAEPALINASSFTVPSEQLELISSSGSPTYTVLVSAPNPDTGETLWAAAYIMVVSPPAILRLAPPAAASAINADGNYYFSDDVGAVYLSWTLDNFDADYTGSEYEFYVTRNGNAVADSYQYFKEGVTQGMPLIQTGDYSFEGYYALNITPVAGSVKDVYTVNVKAKNAMDSTWSYDSAIIYVYKNDWLRLELDGQVQSSSTELTNVDRIKIMTNDERVALKRDISLKRELNINYSSYPDISIASDQIAWESSDQSVAPVYYKTRGIPQNIEDYGALSYLPTQSFYLFGKDDGTARITATHARSGAKTTLDVSVETLQDKLYLFQFYPKAKTEVTYTNGNDEKITVYSDNDGALALFDDYGVASDVYATSDYATFRYTGVISKYTLMTKEPLALNNELYPLNTLKLRQLAKIDIYVKKPDGSPYVGSLTYNGGVYKNGDYCLLAELKNQTATLGADGKLTLMFDTTQFYVTPRESNAADLSAQDKIKFICEILVNGYSPMLTAFLSTINSDDEMRFGSKIHNLQAEKGSDVTMAAQLLWYGDEAYCCTILDYSGFYGPLNETDEFTVETIFSWKNGADFDATARADMTDTVGYRPAGQSCETKSYPFSAQTYMIHKQVYKKDMMWFKKADSRSILYKIYNKTNSLKQTIWQKATLINMIGVEDVNEGDIRKMLSDLENLMSGNPDTQMIPDMGGYQSKMMDVLKRLNFSTGPLTMKIVPTKNPLVYKALVASSLGNVPDSLLNVEGGGSITGDMGGKLGLDLVPSPLALYKMKQDTYTKTEGEKLLKHMNDNNNSGYFSDGTVLYSVGGYWEAEIRYNLFTGHWECVTTGGGFTAGGGYEYTFTTNFTAGPIPVTISISIGAAAVLNTRMHILEENLSGSVPYAANWTNPQAMSVNDWIFMVRVLLYVKVFAGVGFDYSVIACKVGFFGMVQAEYRALILHRNYSADEPEDRDGHSFSLGGKVGIEFKFKVLFFTIKYSYTLWSPNYSWLFGSWNIINEYWKTTTGRDVDGNEVKTAALAYLHSIGEDPFDARYSINMESRDYLNTNTRRWAGGLLRSLDTPNSAPAALQTNSYPYADPKLTDDGALFVYLSDSGSQNLEDTVASWAMLSGNSYVDMGPIIPQNAYGDSSLSVAGDSNLAAAVWVRQRETLQKDAGDPVTNEDIALMTNSAEIMCAVYENGSWSESFKLTDNKLPDMAPVVSVVGGKVFVAWRSVYAGNPDNPLDFTERDEILYSVYDGNDWSSPETLYNGTDGAVMGLDAAALSGGTYAAAYSLNKDGRRDVAYAVIDPATLEVARNLKVTDGDGLSEYPKLTSATFADGVERFILAYHYLDEDTGKSDIRMTAFDASGEVYPAFVDSLNDMLAKNAATVGAGFQFVKRQGGSLGSLSLIFKESLYDLPEYSETADGLDGLIAKDVLKAVKFNEENGEIYISGAISVADMPDFTAVDSFDAYSASADGLLIKAVILGTTYTETASVSGIYTATEQYGNSFSVDSSDFSPMDIISGLDMPVTMSVVNQGLTAIEKLSFNLNGAVTELDNLNLMPNTDKTCVVYYSVPQKIADVDYTVTAYFTDGSAIVKNGSLNLNVADIGVAEARTLSEQDGLRELFVPVYNLSDAKLAGSGATVKLGLYSNSNYYDDNLIMSPIVISGDADLALIDGGGYAARVVFDIKSYIQSLGYNEIPENGIRIFIRAWVERDGEYAADYFTQNDAVSVLFENLSAKNNRNQAKVKLELNNGAATSVDLTLQNLHMAPLQNGNVLLNLYTADGELIETKLALAGSLLNIGSEGLANKTVSFANLGDSVTALYFTQTPPATGGNPKLLAAAVSGFTFSFDPDTLTYVLGVQNLTRADFSFVADNGGDDILVEFEDGGTFSGTGNLTFNKSLNFANASKPRSNDFTVTVSDGVRSTEYLFSVTVTADFTPAGSGTKQDPFIIATTEQLEYLGQQVNAGNDYDGMFFKLIADLNLGGLNWTPIGTAYTSFKGSFDGDSHTIDGMTINNTTLDEAGLFGYVGDKGAIENLGLTNVNIVSNKGGVSVGSLAGTLSESSVTNCYVSGETSVINSAGDGASVGGLVGGSYGSFVTDSYAGAKITSAGVNTKTGGLVGYSAHDNINGSFALIEEMEGTGGDIVLGGLVGCGYGSSIDSCFAIGILDGESDGTEEGDVVVGGLVGVNNNDNNGTVGSITKCYAMAEASATNASTATGATGAYPGGVYVGGLVGINGASCTITDCYAGMSSFGASASGVANIGGLAGVNDGGVITKCYAKNIVMGASADSDTYVGGLAGYNREGEITNCYYDTATTMQASGVGGDDNGTVTVSDLNTMQMTDMNTLVSGGAMSALGTTNWIKRDNDGSARYYPELRVFAEDISETLIKPLLSSLSVAVFNPIITFDANGGSVTPAYAQTGSDYKLASLPTPTRSGYTFNGWYTNEFYMQEVTTETMFMTDWTIIAKWTENSASKVTVSFNASGGNGTMSAVTAPQGSYILPPCAFSRSGYSFTGWKIANSGSTLAAGSSITLTGSITLYAQWTYSGSGVTPDPTPSPDPTTSLNPTVRINGIDFPYTINAGGIVTIEPIEIQIKKLIENAKGGAISLDFSAINGITGIKFRINPKWFSGSGKSLIIKFNGYSFKILDGMLKDLVNNHSGMVVFFISAGSILVSVTQNGKEISWYNYEYPMSIGMPVDSDKNSVMRDKTTSAVIPRSWYEDGIVYANVYEAGAYEAVTATPIIFTDTQGKWMDIAAQYMSARGIISGIGNNLFAPEQSVTRAEFAAMLMSALNIEPQGDWRNTTQQFSDVPEEAWYYDTLRRARNLGIVSGVGNKMYNPNATITRQDMFLMLCNAMAKCGLITTVTAVEEPKWFENYMDKGDISSYARQAMATFIKEGIVSGKGGGKLDPKGTAARAEAAQIIYNMLLRDTKNQD